MFFSLKRGMNSYDLVIKGRYIVLDRELQALGAGPSTSVYLHDR